MLQPVLCCWLGLTQPSGGHEEATQGANGWSGWGSSQERMGISERSLMMEGGGRARDIGSAVHVSSGRSYRAEDIVGMPPACPAPPVWLNLWMQKGASFGGR